MNSKAGELYIVATPIGNLKDMSYRAVEVLQQVELILVEDTRNAIKLLRHYGIQRPMQAFHEHNESHLAESIVDRIKQGDSIALISDAGTPLVSDPGFRLVKRAQESGVQAVTVPGACAAIAALSISGLATDRFAFEGFLPARTSAREKRLRELSGETRTLVFYEACHRIVAFLESLQSVFGATRNAVVARELTKKFETVYHGGLLQLATTVSEDELAQKGEFVVMVEGARNVVDDIDLDKALKALMAEMSVSKASKLASKITGVNKNQCYQRALQLQS